MKSIEVRFAEAMEAIKKANRMKQYDEKAPKTGPIEAKLNCAEAVLKEAGIVRESEVTVTGRVEDPKPRVVKKNNGAADNRDESNPLRHGELFVESFSPGYTQTNTAKVMAARADKTMADGWLKAGKITEAEHAKLCGAKPEGYEQLSEGQRKAFDFHRSIGINEADCFRLAKMNVNSEFKEVSRR